MKQPTVAWLDILPMLALNAFYQGNDRLLLCLASVLFVGRGIGLIMATLAIINAYAFAWSIRCSNAGMITMAMGLVFVAALCSKVSV